ncbi:MAG: hypothetical protein JSU85_12370 [Candidatus Zixiibacteriota bacterium]|nr:MAG: hypothetical protein JSU85_12370 [candidate division Zixibacteria bacterium]
MRLIIISIMMMSLIFGVAGAQVLDGVPHLISYQGLLTDSDGNAVADGEYVIDFTIWSDSVSVSPTDREWISPSCTVLVVNGLFNWQLGSRENLPPWTMTNDVDLWLGIQVESDPEITPRARLCSAPYAYKAWQADYAEYADSAGNVVTAIGEAGEFDGEVNTDMVEYGMGITVIEFETPFTTVEKPHMYISVVLRGPANGLTEGSAIRAVEDVKGSIGNWTGFDITVSKYSDGSSISDTSPVFVNWMAIVKH